MAKLTVLYDNEALQEDLRADWGFSCLVEINDRRLLFDTGAKGSILRHNMKGLGVDPGDIGDIFLSHDHWDHTGGLGSVLRSAPRARVYRPDLSSGPREFLPGLVTTGLMAGVEQSLIIRTARGLVVICGCSHPGLERILDVARGQGDVYAVLGGFHGFDEYDALRDVSMIFPCHCTRHKREIMASYPDRSHRCGAGISIEI